MEVSGCLLHHWSSFASAGCLHRWSSSAAAGCLHRWSSSAAVAALQRGAAACRVPRSPAEGPEGEGKGRQPGGGTAEPEGGTADPEVVEGTDKLQLPCGLEGIAAGDVGEDAGSPVLLAKCPCIAGGEGRGIAAAGEEEEEEQAACTAPDGAAGASP